LFVKNKIIIFACSHKITLFLTLKNKKFMNRNLFTTMLLCSAVALFSACSDTDNKGNGTNPGIVEFPDADDPVNNTFSFAGQDYLFDHGIISYYGDSFETGDTENVVLNIFTEDETTGILLDIVVPQGTKTLIPGTYNFGTEARPFTIIGGEDGYSDVLYEEFKYAFITGGKVTVRQSGDVYALDIDVDTESGKLVGKCTMAFGWEDARSIVGNITIDDTEYPMAIGQMLYNGPDEGGASENVNLLVANADISVALVFGMFVQPGSQRLVAGTYTLSDNRQPFTYAVGVVSLGENDQTPVTDGTIEVAQDGDIYTVTFDLTAGDKVITGTVTGAIRWIDNTESGDEW
jgi:hypothetical protein